MSYNSDGENDAETKDYEFRRDSDEDTEDASETEAEKKEEEFMGVKDQVYHDQLKYYRRQMQQLKEGTLPVYLKKLKGLEQQYQDRLLMNDIISSMQLSLFEQEFYKEKEQVNKEFEEKKSEMKENLLKELEHKKKVIEAERHVMELTGDTTCVKPVTTRKLRRRPNDPPPLPEKRNKPSPVQLSLGLTEHESLEDVARLSKLSKSQGGMAGGFSNNAPFNQCSMPHDVFVEEGKLYIDNRCYSKEQSVMVDSKEHSKFNAYISSINNDEVIVKRVSDNTKLRITISNLQRGHYFLKKRL